METIVQRADVSSTLVQLLTSPDMKIKSILVEIFAVICAVSSKVLEYYFFLFSFFFILFYIYFIFIISIFILFI
jgi:hypothetical protein